MLPADKYLVLFDGVCNLCNGAVRFIIKRDRMDKFAFAPLQSPKGKQVLSGFGLPVTGFNSFVLIKGGKYYLKSTAGLLVVKELGGFWKLLYGLIIVPKPIRDFIYGVIANNRYKVFGRKDACMIPSDAIRNKFVE